MRAQRVEISYKTIIFTILFLISLALLWEIRSILLLFFVCLIFAEILNPIATRLEKFKIPRAVAIFLIYLTIIAVFSGAIVGLVPGLVEQTAGLISTLPDLLNHVSVFGFKFSSIDWSSQIQLLQNLPSEVAQFTISFFSNIFSGFIVLVITFYLIMQRRQIHLLGMHFFGEYGQKKTIQILDHLEVRLGKWIGAELILMLIVGILSYLGYMLIGLKFAIPLGLIAGLMEIIPTIGPIVTAVLAGLVGLTISPFTALLAVVWGFIVQQLENNFIVPKIMKEAIGLNPLITIFTIATGAHLGGVGGALLAVPFYLIIETCVKIILEK